MFATETEDCEKEEFALKRLDGERRRPTTGWRVSTVATPTHGRHVHNSVAIFTGVPAVFFTLTKLPGIEI